MNKKVTKKKASKTAKSAKENPYFQMITQDKAFQENMRHAYESANAAVKRASKSKGASGLLDDKKFQRNLSEAANAIGEVGRLIKQGPQKRRRKGKGGVFVGILFVGGIVAMIFNEKVRNKVLDTLFGAEEEFEYPSTASAPGPTPETPGTAKTTDGSEPQQ